VHWQELYISQLAQSGYLLQYINSKWDNLKKLDTPLFRDTLQVFLGFFKNFKPLALLCTFDRAEMYDLKSRLCLFYPPFLFPPKKEGRRKGE
jgi:hypothetical protein